MLINSARFYLHRMTIPRPNPFVLSAPPNPSPDPFRGACNQGNLDAIKQYIRDRNPDSFTLSMGLKHATAANQVEVVHYFLEIKVNINQATLRFIQSPKVWEIFLNNGVQLNPTSIMQDPPLM